MADQLRRRWSSLVRSADDGGSHAAQDVLLVETAAKTPVEEASRAAPLENIANGALGLHTSSTIVKISELNSDLRVNRQQLLLAGSHLLLNLVGLLGRQARVIKLLLESSIGRIHADDGLDLLLLAVLDTNHTLGLKNTTTGLGIGVHLHGSGVDGRIDNDPRSTTKLTEGRDVDEDGLLVLDEGIDDERTVLEDLVVHVALTTRETTPVGKDHQRKLLTVVEVVDSLGIRVGRVGRSDVLDGSDLDTDNTHRDTAETSTTNDNSLGPTTKSLDERVLVKETRLEAVLTFTTTDQPSDIVRLLLGRVVSHITVPVVDAGADRNGAVALLGYKRHPLENLRDTSKVIVGSHVGGVNLTTKQIVEGSSTSQDDGLTLNLDSTLAKTDKVGTNTNGSASYQSDGKDVVVSAASGTSDETRATQTLNTKTLLLTDNGNNLVSLLAILSNLLSNDILLEASLGLVVKVEVLEASVLLLRVVPGNLVVAHKLIGKAETSTRVGRQVDTGDTKLTGKLSDIVGDNDKSSAVGVLRGASPEDPTNHTTSVILVVQNKLGEADAITGLGLLGSQAGLSLDGLGPSVLDGLAEKLREIVNVLSSHTVSVVTLGLEPVLDGVRGRDGHQVHGTLLVSASNAVEDPHTLLRLALSVHVDIDDVTRGVGDNNTERVGLAGLGISADDADLDLSDAESPSTDTKSVKEALETLLDLLGLKSEHGREVDEDVVQIRVVVADNLESVKDIVDNTVSLGDEVLSSRDLISETARSDDSTCEVSLVSVMLLANTLVNVDALVLSENRLDVELAETSKLKLESKGRLAVTDTVVLLVLGSTESVVSGVRAIAVTADECQTANTTGKELILVLLDNGEDILESLSVVAALNITNSNVDNSRELLLVLLERSRLALAGEVGDQARSVLLLLLLLMSEGLEGLANEILGLIDVLARNNDTLASGLILPLAVKVGHVADGVDSLEVELASAGCSRGRRSSRLKRKTELRLAKLSELEVPRDELRVVVLILVVLNLLEEVRTVGSANVNLKRGQRHPRIIVGEEHGQDIKDSVLGVNDLLDDIKARLTVVPTSFTISRLNDGRAKDVLHLGSSLLKRGESTLDHDLTGLEGNLGGVSGLKLGKKTEGLTEVLGDVSSLGLVGSVLLKNSKDERALRADAAMRQNSVDNLHDIILVLGLGREVGVARLAALNDLGELSIELLRHTRVEGGELSVPLAVGKLGVAEDLDELPQGAGHDNRVVVTQKNVLEGVVEEREALSGLGTDNNRLAVRGKLVDESLSLLDAAGVIESKDTEDITSLEGGSGLLDELDNTILLGKERHVHLHDLDLGKGLTSTNMGTVLDRILDKLTRARRSELGGVVLLLEQASLAVNGQTGGANLFLPVDAVRSSVEKDKDTTIAQGTDTNMALGTVDEKVVAVNAGTSGCELVTETLVDEVDGENSLQDVLGGHLTLLKAGSVLSHASLAGNVSLGNSTTGDSKHGLGSLSGKTLGDKLIQPTSGDGVVLEGLGLEKLDEVLNGGSEITTNAQLLQGHDHVLP
ncbi:unnamed protein product [Fusarium venenatum]|uniref:Uncharacterized protein n=1 Tax=Fusarium venenatum TaxID=56646 RepID=A0A2L2TAP5_9HYPO|nr:uncharacterized protein FVRRES_11273 [Fusarium venenatum]CEI38582.1 unnamed protein product [Fusarium venenatum]